MRSQIHDQGQPVVGEPRVDAVDPQRRAAGLGGVHDPLVQLAADGALRVLEEDRARRHDVDAGPEEALEVGQRVEQAVVGPRGVDDAVGRQREQGVGVVGRGDPQVAVEPREPAGVDTDLGGVRHPHPDEVEVRTGVDAGERMAPHVPGAPLHDSIAHGSPLVLDGGLVETGPPSSGRGRAAR